MWQGRGLARSGSRVCGGRRVNLRLLPAWRFAALSLVIASTVSCTTALPMAEQAAEAPAAREFALTPTQTVVGEVREYVVQPGEDLNEIARKFDLGYTALAAANPGVDQFAPGVGRRLIIPSLYVLPDTPRQGIVINLAQYRMFYFPPGGHRVETFPVGLGQIGKTTPLGVTRVARKEANPTWYPPRSIRSERPELTAAVPPGPDNPLGKYAMHLGWPRYLIHGTNKPDGVGRNVSHGCIRMYPEDIERLFSELPVGTPVRTVNEPVTAGWVGDRLYLKVYPSKTQTEEIDTAHRVRFEPAIGASKIVRAAAGSYANTVDWRAVDKAARERTGAPVIIADRSAPADMARKSEDVEASIGRAVRPRL
jgi:L,D-transpeptidase ErfK/SrfK